jgi:hypothetical protein
MALIKTIEELQQYITTDVNLKTNNILPYQENTKAQIVRLLGKTLYDELQAWYDDGDTDDAALEALLPYVQRPLANFTMHLAISALNVVIGPTGIGVVSTQSVAPASKDRTDALKADLLNTAWDAMEDLLEFLEANIDDYDSWSSSEAYSQQYEILIPSARRFDEILRIDRSRLKYLEWRPTMMDVELMEIVPQISQEMVDELKGEIKLGAVTANNQKVLDKVQKALAYLTAYVEYEPEIGTSATYSITMRSFSDSKREHYKQTGMKYLMSAKALMDANPTDYPTYTASDVYDAEITSYTRYENDADSKFIVLG